MGVKNLLNLVEDSVQLLPQLPVLGVVCLGGDVSAEIIPVIKGELHGLIGRCVPNDLGVVVVQAHEVVQEQFSLGGGQFQPGLGAGFDVFGGRHGVFL